MFFVRNFELGTVEKVRILATCLTLLVLGACGTTGIVYSKDENGITLAQGNRQASEDVYDEAQRHCQQFNKNAILLLVNTKILTHPVTFECR